MCDDCTRAAQEKWQRVQDAAPALLAACEAFVDLWPMPEGRTEPKGTPDVIRAWRLCKAALAAARD